MFTAWKTLLGSKKFWLTVVGSSVVAALDQFGVGHDILAMVSGLFGANVLGQGISDTSKK